MRKNQLNIMSAQKILSTNSIVFELQKCYIQKNKSQLTPRGGGHEAYEERINLRLFLNCLDMNYAADGAKTADDVSQNFLN